MVTFAIMLLLVTASALPSCGDEKPAAVPAASPAPASEIPEDLTGTWEARIPHDELAVLPDGVPVTPSVWTLKFLGTGGDDNGPSMFLSNDRVGEFVGPVSVSGDEITVQFESECKEYVVRVEEPRGSTRPSLHLDPAGHLDGCPSTAISSVLAARGWTRIDGGSRATTHAPHGLAG